MGTEDAREAPAAQGERAALALGAQVGPATGTPRLGIGLEGAVGRADEAKELRLGPGASAAHAAAHGRRAGYLASRAA